MKKYLILFAILSGVALAWAAPPIDKLPPLLSAPEALARTVIIVQGTAAASYEIEDLFGSDTTANYTKIMDDSGTASLSVSGGALRANNFTVSRWFHETALSSANHYVQGSFLIGVEGDPAYGDSALPIARSDGTSGATADYYYIDRDASTYDLYRVNNASATYLTSSASGQATGTITIRMEVSGTGATVNIKLIYGGSTIIDYDDSSASRLTSGSYVGFRIKEESGYTQIDNFIADNL